VAKTVCLTKGPIAKGMISFAIPLLLSNLFQQLYNAVDSAVVGRFAGSVALAAVGSTGSVINLLVGFFLGLATGTGVLYAMRYGAEDYPGLKRLIDSALVLSVIASVIITVIGILFCRRLLIWMDCPEDVLPLSTAYLRIIFSGIIFTMLYNVGAGMVRAEGDSTRPLIYLISGGIMNLIMDLILVAGFGMGVEGAAIATVAAQAVSAVLVIYRLTRLRADYRFRPLRIRPDRETFSDVIRISVPCGLQGSMFNIANLIVQAKFNSFGTMAMAGISAYTNIDGFIYMPLMALALAITTYVGQNVGAQEYTRIRKGIRVCLILSISSAIVMSTLVLLFCDKLLFLFTDEPAAQEFALQMMTHMAPFSFVFCFCDILGGAIRGAGQAMKVTVITALCICAFRVLWLMVMLHFFHDIRLVFVCYPLSWSLGSLVMTIFYFKGSDVYRMIKSGAKC